MSEAIHAEVVLLAGSLAVGLGLMAVYDGLRIFRVLIPHGTLWTGLEDVCYWLFSGISTFLLLFYQNDGVLRGYAICGVLTGMLFYNMTVSRILLRVLKKVEKYFTIKKKRKRTKEEMSDEAGEDDAGKRPGKKKEKRKSE